MNEIITTGTERLDTLCWRHYGHLQGTVEAVLAANIGLADTATDERGRLPAGVRIIMPALPAPLPAKVVLW